MFSNKFSCVVKVLRIGSRSQHKSIRRKKSGLSYIHHTGTQPLKYCPLGQILTESADKWPDRPAVISKYENKVLTFEQLLLEVDKLAASLKSLGLEKGDRFGIWLPNSTQWVVAVLAASRSGLISVAINHSYNSRELEYALKKAGIKAVIAPGSKYHETYFKTLIDIVPEILNSKVGELKCDKLKELKYVILADPENIPNGVLDYKKLIDGASINAINEVSREAHNIDPDSPCNIQYTSGTTGNPKAAVLSHYNIVNNGYCIGHRNELDQGYKKICVQVPLFHVFGVVVTISAALQHGATMVFPSPVYSPRANLNALFSEKCEVIHGTPTMHIDLVNTVRDTGVTGLKSEIAVTGGAPVTPQLVKDLSNKLNVSKVKSIFGMTEATAVSFQSLVTEDPERPLHYLGHLHDHLEAKVVDEQNRQVPFGQPGELFTRGYSTMIKYWDDEAKTKEILTEDNWIRSGDLVTLHEDGYAQISGRLKDLIIRGGENIAPKEIEDVLSTHPDVLECQVFGIQDDRLGEEIAAAIRVKDGATFDSNKLMKHVQQKLAKYKVPRVMKKVDAFPKTASGKVQKFKLRMMLESGQL